MTHKQPTQRAAEENRKANDPTERVAHFFPEWPVYMHFPSKDQIAKVIQINTHCIVKHVVEMTVLAANHRSAFLNLAEEFRLGSSAASSVACSEPQKRVRIAACD